jgi:hypothetical protein
MMGDGGWMMDDGWGMIGGGCCVMDDYNGWWMIDDGWWMMGDG